MNRASAGRKAQRKGQQAELKTWQHLEEQGYEVILGRSGKTRSDCIDGVAVGRNNIIFFQTKAYDIPSSDEAILQERFNNLAHLPGVSYQLWEWREGKLSITDMT